MYVECKAENLNGPARIGRVSFSKTGKTLYYGGRSFQSIKGGYKANYFDLETGDEYWISGCRKDGPTACTRARFPSKSMTTCAKSIG